MSDISELNDMNVGLMAQIFTSKQMPTLVPTCDNLRPGQQTSQVYQAMKRSLDIGGALLGLLILALFLPVVALLIFCEDRGPVFYKQQRLGLRGQPFSTYKLRSMMKNADTYLMQHPTLEGVWRENGKLYNDPRVTRIGHFLRRSSLDEMPQMLNVLRGEMSLVGPRAVQPSEAEAFGELYELRHTVKPGLTGLWQVCGRSHTDYQQRCVLDCTYAMERSLEIDIRILMKTFPTIVRGKGAY